MRRSAHVTAPLLVTAAAAVISGCHEATLRSAPTAAVESHGETRVGGFGASFDPVTLWVVALGGIAVVVLRSQSGGG